MLPGLGRWKLHRWLVDTAKILHPFSRRGQNKKVLFISERDIICYAQIFPFFLSARELAADFGIEMRELPLRHFLNGRHPYAGAVDAVCFQTWFDLTPDDIGDLARRIASTWPGARLAYFDWFAPTDLRYAEALDPHVHAYVKKQLLKDIESYGRPTLGDTNLTDYYAKRFSLSLPERTFHVPRNFHEKLVLGSGFEYSPAIMKALTVEPDYAERPIDLHARIAVKGTEWYTAMRNESQVEARKLDGRFKVAWEGRVSPRQYFAELRQSKLCFSPFGYGEVCWRDIEAMATGALLLKPDMSHLRLATNLFQPGRTYIPIRWDLSDLAEKVSYYRDHPQERRQIAKNAFEMLQREYRSKGFLKTAAPLLQLLGLAGDRR